MFTNSNRLSLLRKLLHYNTTLAIIFLFPLVLFSGELTDILTQSEAIYDSGFWMLMVSRTEKDVWRMMMKIY